MGVLLNLQVYRGGQLVAQHQFDSDTNRTVKIGRLSSAQVKLDDPAVSRIHAVIELGASEVALHDMGTTAGTAVNGVKVVNAKLKTGDQITVGDSLLVVMTGAPGAVMPVQAPVGVAVPATGAASPMAPAGPLAFGSPFGAAASPVPLASGQPVARTAAPATMPAPAGWGSPVSGRAVVAGNVVVAPSLAGTTSAPAAVQPRFDPGSTAGAAPVRRITNQRLGAAAVESRPHPALAPEQPMTAENRILEMRLYWGEVLLGISHYDKPKRITIGETKKTNVFISSEGLPVEEFPLVRYMDDEYILTFTSHMEGEIEIGGRLQSLPELRGSSAVRKDDHFSESYQVRMSPDARAVVHWGGATFALRFVAPSEGVPKSFWQNIDLHYLNVAVASLFFHIALIATLLVYPYDTESLREDLFDKPDRFASLILEPPKQSESNKNLLEKIKKEVEQKKEELAKQAEEKPQPQKQLKTVTKIQPPTNIKPRQPTQAEKSAAVREKFSKLFTGGGGIGGSGSILGGGGGGSLSGTLAGVIGTAGVGSATAGMAGLGIRGTGPMTGGGVGTSRGIAGIGTTGRLGGGGLAYGSNVGLGNRRDRGAIEIGPPRIEGNLAAELIKKVIDENKAQIKYCYEIELQRDQSLEGRVLMTWVISATGSVATVAVRDSTIKNAAVEACMMARIKNWKFPAPAGGGTATVNYPFIFKAT